MRTAARGRPTPQPAAAERPRFRDRKEYALAVNPYVAMHRTYASCLLPANEAWTWRDRWPEKFGREAPLHLEIGPGNGEFLQELALRHPEVDFVGVEIRYKRCVMVAKRLMDVGATNAVVCRYHAAFLDDLLAPGSLSAIYVNHPDPWPKGRHEKNRLISRWFLTDAASLLMPGGVLRLKSDTRYNVDRAEQLIDKEPNGEPAEPLPFEVTGRSEDVTTGPAPWPDDIETNYQKKFRLKGEPVYAIELRRT